MSSQYGNWTPAVGLVRQEPGAAFSALPWMYDGANSPWPTLMPPESVPVLLYTRLLAICMLCPQAWTKMPPPPWELFVIPNPSILDGLHQKLLGNGFLSVLVFRPQLLAVNSVVPPWKTP